MTKDKAEVCECGHLEDSHNLGDTWGCVHRAHPDSMEPPCECKGFKRKENNRDAVIVEAGTFLLANRDESGQTKRINITEIMADFALYILRKDREKATIEAGQTDASTPADPNQIQ